MGRSHDRGRRGEQRIEALTGAKRVKHRPRYAKLPDLWPLVIPSGETLQFESKAGANVVPKKLLKDIAQARSYSPHAVPVAVYSDVGESESIACLPLKDLARLLGLRVTKCDEGQLALGRTG